jgi:hypothetical protein
MPLTRLETYLVDKAHGPEKQAHFYRRWVVRFYEKSALSVFICVHPSSMIFCAHGTRGTHARCGANDRKCRLCVRSGSRDKIATMPRRARRRIAIIAHGIRP